MPRKHHYIGFHLDPRSLASMRPGLLCPGSPAMVAFVDDLVAASMRPGLLCPGSNLKGVRKGGRNKASMRPGLLCPGSRLIVERDTAAVVKLQ